MSLYTAIVAVTPDIEAEFIDENAMAEMPIELQHAIRGRQRGQMSQFTRGANNFIPYRVWGSAEALAEAEERWGGDIIIIGTWDAMSGCRAGQAYIMQEGAEHTPETPVYERVKVGAPIREIDAELLNILPPKQIAYIDRNQVEQPEIPATDVSHLHNILGYPELEL